ncbi:hypothetical protein IWZ00DRAFT_486475 [Phyllosticta capitalensis]
MAPHGSQKATFSFGPTPSFSQYRISTSSTMAPSDSHDDKSTKRSAGDAGLDSVPPGKFPGCRDVEKSESLLTHQEDAAQDPATIEELTCALTDSLDASSKPMVAHALKFLLSRTSLDDYKASMELVKMLMDRKLKTCKILLTNVENQQLAVREAQERLDQQKLVLREITDDISKQTDNNDALLKCLQTNCYTDEGLPTLAALNRELVKGLRDASELE